MASALTPPIGEPIDLDAAVLGGALPDAAAALIAQAGRLRGEPAAALALLDLAQAKAPDHPAVLIARYRFHFYANRLRAARGVAEEALQFAARALGLPPDLPACWRDTQPAPCFVALAPLPRFYLFTLKGYAYLSLRLGEIESGRAALAKLAELDPADRIGHRVLATVLTHQGRDDLGYEDCPDIAEAIS